MVFISISCQLREVLNSFFCYFGSVYTTASEKTNLNYLYYRYSPHLGLVPLRLENGAGHRQYLDIQGSLTSEARSKSLYCLWPVSRPQQFVRGTRQRFRPPSFGTVYSKAKRLYSLPGLGQERCDHFLIDNECALMSEETNAP